MVCIRQSSQKETESRLEKLYYLFRDFETTQTKIELLIKDEDEAE